MIKVIDGEPLPAPAAKSEWSGNSDVFEQMFEYAPFLLFGAVFFGSILRTVLGRLLGSLAFGGLITLGMWVVLSSFPVALLLGVIAGIISLIGDAFGSSGGGGSSRSSGGSWSSGSSSSSSSGSFSGGGGSFGGGGASGSW
jgi:uncharacterized protein